MAFIIVCIAVSVGCGLAPVRRPWMKAATLWNAEEVEYVWEKSPWVQKKQFIVGGETSAGRTYTHYDNYNCLYSPPSNDNMVCVGTSMTWVESHYNPFWVLYRVRWMSSHAMCSASRLNLGLQPDLQESCGEEQDTLRIAIHEVRKSRSGPSLETLAAHSYLRPRKLKQEVRALSSRPDPDRRDQYILEFPRQLPDGRPTIAPNETVVEFVLSDGKRKWKVKFRLREMVGPGGRDL